jgi:L-malate glycosyltransferase
VSDGPRVAYATTGWSIHDQRWLDALRDNGLDPAGVSVAAPGDRVPEGVAVVPGPAELRSHLVGLAARPGGLSVLAGPLTTVTAGLVGIPARLVGLSWGWDLQPEAIGQAFDAEQLAWLSALDALIVDSVVTRQVALGLGVDAGRIALIPWGADTALFTPDGPRTELTAWGVVPTDHVVLSLRSHTPIHRVGDVIEAFAIASAADANLLLLVGGDGPMRGSLESRVAELGLAGRVRFVGRLDESELPALLRSVGLYVSATAVDGTSVTLLQALACGTPVAVSDIPGNRPWADQPWTRLFPLGDTARLADEMLRTAYAPAGRREPQRLAERRRQEISWARNATALVGIMRPEGPHTAP